MPEAKSPLTAAILSADVAAVKALLAGVRLNEAFRKGATELCAAANAGHAEIVGLLLDAGAEIDARDNETWTALMYAASEGHVAVMKLLLDRGANMWAGSIGDANPLSVAVTYGQAAAVRLLLERGANPDAKGPYNVQTRSSQWLGDSSNPEIRRLFEEFKAKRDAARPPPPTPLDRKLLDAAFAGDAEKVGSLLEEGANVEARLERGAPALVMAAKRGHLAVVALLLEKGAGADAVEELSGQTALMKAAVFDRADVVKLLLEKGADKARLDAKGKTAKQLAKSDALRELL